MSITSLKELFDKIYNLYNSKEEKVKIFDVVYDNYKYIIDIIEKSIILDKESNNKFIFFYKDYFSIDDFHSCYKIIENDKNCEYERHMLFVISFRIVILNLINLFNDSKMIGKNEMTFDEKLPFPKNTKYNIITTNKRENIIKFASYILVYYLESYFSKKQYIGLDFEFRQRQIALIQINFESSPSSNDNSYIFMVLPTEFDKILLDFFRNKILQNKYIKKILHGSDSLDIPYIFSELLEENKNHIINFVNNLVDTRFFCEYIRLIKSDEGKCKIYDALLYFKTITQDKYDYLITNNKNMGPEEQTSWDIHSLSPFQTLYAVYDVLFLKKFYYDILNSVGKTDDLRIYKYFIPEFTRFVFLEKRGITRILKKSKIQTDTVNNFMIKRINKKTNYIKNITLVTIYNAVVQDLVVENPHIEINKLMKINYFRGELGAICKKIIYHIISFKYKIYRNKTEIYEEKIPLYDLVEYFEEYNFLNLKKFIGYIKIKSNILIYEKLKYL